VTDDKIDQYTFNLYESDITDLKWLAALRECNVTQALRAAIATDKYLHKEAVRNEAVTMLQYPDGVMKQVIFNFKRKENDAQ
jgi:hypothetical protein